MTLLTLMVLLKFSASEYNYTALQDDFKSIEKNNLGYNISFNQAHELFWVRLNPNKLDIPHKKVLILGGLYGSDLDSRVVFYLLHEIISSGTEWAKNIRDFLQVDFFPVPNYKLYKYLEGLSEKPTKTIFSDLSLTETCNDKLSGIDPDSNFEAEWKPKGNKCEIGYSGEKAMESYVTTEIDYASYDVIFNIQAAGADFVCGPYSTTGKNVDKIYSLYKKAFQKNVGDFDDGNCYDVLKKKRYGTIIDYAASKGIFALHLSKNKGKTNEFQYLANVTSELFTGPYITFDSRATENIEPGSIYSAISWSFEVTNYDDKEIKVYLNLKLATVFTIYNITKVKRQGYDLKMNKQGKKQTLDITRTQDLEISFEDDLQDLSIFKYTVYIEKFQDIEEFDFHAYVKVSVNENQSFEKEHDSEVIINLDEEVDNFEYTYVVILLMILVFAVSIIGIFVCVMMDEPCKCSKPSQQNKVSK